MSDVPPPPPPTPAGPPPPVAAPADPVRYPDDYARTEGQKARSAKALAGWTIGCTALLVIVCSGGIRFSAAVADGLAVKAEREVDRLRASTAKVTDAGTLLDLLGDQLREGGRELPETLPEAAPKDPWGNGIRYARSSPRRATLTSAGPDGVFRTHDDVFRALEIP